MRYRVSHDKYFLDPIGESLLAEIAQRTRWRIAFFLAATRDITSSSTGTFQEKCSESNGRDSISIFTRGRLYFVRFSGTQPKHATAKVCNWLKEMYEEKEG